ncbi:hypothetical protein ACJRO7_017576 [Eucalyptus globulus]|uniref:DUF4220 domain-containing protein n=1 Tax=Eucalyptus globulus TaxID=34317 RepID=A0ABD3KQM4_EUCGL
MRNLMETNKKMAKELATIRNCNVTLGNMKSLKTPVGRLLHIELLVIFNAFLFLSLVTVSSWRRRSNSKMFKLFIFTAYNLSTFLLTYALSLMHDAPFHNELFPIWAMLLMIAFGSTDSISAYCPDDNEQWKRNNWQLLIKSIWLVWLIELYFRDGSKVLVAAECLFIVLAVKFFERARAMMAASRHSLESNTKVVADYYMRVEYESKGRSADDVDLVFDREKRKKVYPISMRGYTYLVWGDEGSFLRLAIGSIRSFLRCVGIPGVEEAPDYRVPFCGSHLITVEEVWNCGGMLSSPQGGGPHNRMKDKCLSFAHENAWKLIRHILLSQEDGYKRMFRVVEVELTFLFDFFYTKYGIIFQRGWLLIKLLELMGIAMGIWATISLLKQHKRHNSNCRLTTMPNGLSVDVFVTIVMTISFIIMDLMQFFFTVFSDWAKVIFICKYVQYKSLQENLWIGRMIRAICGVRSRKPWERKLRQYSFLESYSYKPSKLLNNAIMVAFIDQTKDGQRQSKPIQLDEKVKQAVFDALKSIKDIKLENGEASLTRNLVSDELSWACQLETQTQVIMVWHIATSFCEHQLQQGRSNLSIMRNSLVTTNLSKYLAYLVAFAPWLLPDHPSVADYVFNQAIIETKDFFQNCKTMDNRVKEMKRMGRAGLGLGYQLVNDINDKEIIWRILADFWVELVLYVAPLDNARAHVEHLARGGEFVTHLWGLLSHTRIERRPPTKPPNVLERSNSF